MAWHIGQWFNRPHTTTSDIVCVRIPGIKFDITALREHFDTKIRPTARTTYADHNTSYAGWAITSRDGTVGDGVKYIPAQESPTILRAHIRSPLCTGYLASVLDTIERIGFRPRRVRVMSMDSDGPEMSWHQDAISEAWRIHIPIATNDHAYFEWKRKNGEPLSIHLPADGTAWLTRTDQLHRAVNRGNGERVHLLMEIRIPVHRILEKLTKGSGNTAADIFRC